MRRIVMGVLLAGLALAGSCKAEVSCGKKRESVQSALEPKLEELPAPNAVQPPPPPPPAPPPAR